MDSSVGLKVGTELGVKEGADDAAIVGLLVGQRQLALEIGDTAAVESK